MGKLKVFPWFKVKSEYDKPTFRNYIITRAKSSPQWERFQQWDTTFLTCFHKNTAAKTTIFLAQQNPLPPKSTKHMKMRHIKEAKPKKLQTSLSLGMIGLIMRRLDNKRLEPPSPLPLALPSFCSVEVLRKKFSTPTGNWRWLETIANGGASEDRSGSSPLLLLICLDLVRDPGSHSDEKLRILGSPSLPGKRAPKFGDAVNLSYIANRGSLPVRRSTILITENIANTCLRMQSEGKIGERGDPVSVRHGSEAFLQPSYS